MTSLPRSLSLALVAALTLTLGGCTVPFLPEPDPLPPVETRLPTDELTVVADEDAAPASIRMSESLFASSPVAVLAEVADDSRMAAAASAAIALGVPMLLLDASADPVNAELDRLGVTNVVAFFELDEDTAPGRDIVSVEPNTEDLTRALGIEFTALPAPAAGSRAEAVSALIAGEALTGTTIVASTSTPAPSGSGQLREVQRGETLGAVLVLAVNADQQLATIATARAAGASIQLVEADATNPQGSSDAITSLSDGVTTHVVALGQEYAAEASLEWKIASARTGFQLPAGGQLLFPAHTMVALYGTPGSPVLGVLGEQGLDAAIERARAHAAMYDGLTDTTVLPAFEIITTVASAFAGSDGNYSNELDINGIRPWVEAAGPAGLYVVLDLQPGRTDFLTQAKLYEELLLYPWVGLALDPEWRLGPNERHLIRIGSVEAAEVNGVVDYLTELVHVHDLPPKLLVLHQFRLDMLKNRDQIIVDRDEVPVLIHADGQGSQPAKQDTWQWLRRDAPAVYWGWKNFYDEDIPMLTAEQTVQVSPLPELITYQ